MKWVMVVLCFVFGLTGLSAQGIQDFMVVTEESPPGETLDKNGRVTGPTAEMVRELMRRLGIKKDMELLPWVRAFKMAQAGPRVAVFETTRTEERENQFKWVGPIKRIRWIFYGRSDSPLKISSLEDMKKVNGIAIYNGDARADYLKKLGFTNIVLPNTPLLCVKMLMNQRVDLIGFSDIGTEDTLLQAGHTLSDIKEIFVSETKYLYIALSKDTPEAEVKLWQKTLDAMKKDGTLARYYRGTYPEKMIRDLSIPGDPLAKP